MHACEEALVSYAVSMLSGDVEVTSGFRELGRLPSAYSMERHLASDFEAIMTQRDLYRPRSC
jgi:hypothetical protein